MEEKEKELLKIRLKMHLERRIYNVGDRGKDAGVCSV